MPPTFLAIAFPYADAQRELLRKVMPDHRLPSLYREGAEDRPCTRCGMRLNVGPRLLALLHTQPGLLIYCPICGTAETHGEPTDVMHLGNPESGWDPPKG
jgi:hypothetical protein